MSEFHIVLLLYLTSISTIILYVFYTNKSICYTLVRRKGKTFRRVNKEVWYIGAKLRIGGTYEEIIWYHRESFGRVLRHILKVIVTANPINSVVILFGPEIFMTSGLSLCIGQGHSPSNSAPYIKRHPKGAF